jgi:predicted dehydrogenase
MRLGYGLIGAGFMGKTHTLGFLNVNRVFRLPVEVELRKVAEYDAAVAERAAKSLGYPEFTGDWRTLIGDPAIHIVSIATPGTTHCEMSLAAIAAGKHVYCEKPLATAAEAEKMTAAGEAAGVKTMVGFNYIKNPMMRVAREIIDSGEIGEVRTFRGMHIEDNLMDADIPWHWRLDKAGAGGAMADIGSHILATARYLLGPIVEVLGDVTTVIPSRPVAGGACQTRAVEVEDIARAFVRFERGCSGVIEANWIAAGRKMQHDFEVSGSKGGIFFSQERFSELDLYLNDDRPGRRGFHKIFAGPEHPPYGDFCIAPGHQLGFNDLKTIEVRDFLRAIAGDTSDQTSFREGWEVQKTVEAIYRSSREHRWVKLQ